GLVIPNKRIPTTLGAKMAPALRVATKKAPLVVARRSFRTTKLTPRAWIGAFLDTTEAIQLVLTDPSQLCAASLPTRTGDEPAAGVGGFEPLWSLYSDPLAPIGRRGRHDRQNNPAAPVA